MMRMGGRTAPAPFGGSSMGNADAGSGSMKKDALLLASRAVKWGVALAAVFPLYRAGTLLAFVLAAVIFGPDGRMTDAYDIAFEVLMLVFAIVAWMLIPRLHPIGNRPPEASTTCLASIRWDRAAWVALLAFGFAILVESVGQLILPLVQAPVTAASHLTPSPSPVSGLSVALRALTLMVLGCGVLLTLARHLFISLRAALLPARVPARSVPAGAETRWCFWAANVTQAAMLSTLMSGMTTITTMAYVFLLSLMLGWVHGRMGLFRYTLVATAGVILPGRLLSFPQVVDAVNAYPGVTVGIVVASVVMVSISAWMLIVDTSSEGVGAGFPRS